MGVVVAETIRNSGHEVCWASDGRSAETGRRAAAAGMTDAGSLSGLCEHCAVIVSVCPPEFAENIAAEVSERRFPGLYMDLNAISPQRVQRIQRLITAGGGTFVDGSIIGMPTRGRGETWIYASGEHASQAGEYFRGGPLEFEILGDYPGQASALKMCFAAYSKGTTALLAAVLGSADALGVQDALRRQWARSGPNFERAVASVRAAAPKAWRFTPEMQEIADTFTSAGVPSGFPAAAAEIYAKLASFKGVGDPDLAGVLEKLRE